MEMIIEFAGDKEREIGLYLEDSDTLKFSYLEDGDSTSTKKISIAELYFSLKEVSDWKEQIKREKTNAEIKGWRDKCISMEKEQEKIKEENWKLRSDLQALRETIKIVGMHTGS